MIDIQLATAASVPLRRQSCAAVPNDPDLHKIPKLPDPFAHYPLAQEGRVTTRDEWTCRQQQVATLLQQFELGEKPPTPSKVTSSFNGGTLSIEASEGGQSISFGVSIELPSTGSGPYPAIIAYGYPSIPIPSGVAIISLDNGAIAEQRGSSSRGKGLFYDLYGPDASAGALMAWAWATTLVIDALESTPDANINTKKLGITGCSRNGKGAFVAGAFEPRIALTLPQESGTGGSGCWRLDDAAKGAPEEVQTAGQIVQENVWFSTTFEQYANNVPILPYDHHMLAGLIAPRALLSIDNGGIQWLGPWASWGCMGAAHKIWEALGAPDHMGYSMSSSHPHCQFPNEQKSDLSVFISRFLLDESADTDVQSNYAGISFPMDEWVEWTVPNLAS